MVFVAIIVVVFCDRSYTDRDMGAVRKPLSVSLYKPEIDHIKVCERCAEAALNKCEGELLSELYCMFR